WRAGNVRRDWLAPFLVPGVIGGIFGAYLFASVSQEKFRFWMALVLVCMGVLMLWRAFFTIPEYIRSAPAIRSRPIRRFVLGTLGLAAGLLNSASGAYGPFATSAVMVASEAKPSEVVGTVNFAEFFVASAVVGTFLAQGGVSNFSVSLALALTLGGAITAPLAAYACRRLPPRALQLGVGLALIGLNLRIVVSSIS
ncbi:MAG: sulfite exporter TauE/SafE family protein, partial [Candidatus Binatia bacterium]